MPTFNTIGMEVINMTEKQKKDYTKNMCIKLIEEMIGGEQKKLVPKNKKLLKDFLGKDIYTCLYCIDYVKHSYYSWEVDPNDYEVNKNFDRLVYLLNDSYEMCDSLLHKSSTELNDWELTVKPSKDLRDYRDIEKEVGLK